jgi:hypothetical protein
MASGEENHGLCYAAKRSAASSLNLQSWEIKLLIDRAVLLRLAITRITLDGEADRIREGSLNPSYSASGKSKPSQKARAYSISFIPFSKPLMHKHRYKFLFLLWVSN